MQLKTFIFLIYSGIFTVACGEKSGSGSQIFSDLAGASDSLGHVLQLTVDEMFDPRQRGLARELTPFVEEYVELTGKKIKDLPINFGRIGQFNGRCIKYRMANLGGVLSGIELREILISREFWDGASLAQKRIVMFHELGHCVKDLEHNNNMVYMVNEEVSPGGSVTMTVEHIPESIMHSDLTDAVDRFEDFYLAEVRGDLKDRKSFRSSDGKAYKVKKWGE